MVKLYEMVITVHLSTHMAKQAYFFAQTTQYLSDEQKNEWPVNFMHEVGRYYHETWPKC